MAKLLRFLVSHGIVVENPFCRDSVYHIPQRGDARNDFSRISGDMRKIGQDLQRSANRELNKYVKPH